MAESLTPAGCGSRRSQWFGIALFTLAAIAAAAAVGALAGWIGSVLPGRPVVITVAVAVVVVAALREAGVLRFRVPAIRRQVPEAWRRVLPVPLWTTGYGAILGSGVGTYQPAATFWAVVAAAVAIGDPVTAAVALGAFGLARGVMAASPIGLFDLIARKGRIPLRALNAIILALLAAVLIPTTAGAQTGLLSPTGRADPTVANDVTAVTVYAAGQPPRVEILPPGQPRISIPEVREPAISGTMIAVVTTEGLDVRNWRTDEVVHRIAGRIVHPALSGSRLAYVELLPGGSRLVLRDLNAGGARVLTRVGRGVDLGRPSISGQAVVWHQASGLNSRILMRRVNGGPVSNLFTTRRRWQVTSPSLATGTLVWIEHDAEHFWVRARRLNGGPVHTVARSSREIAVTTATDGTRVWIGFWHGFRGTGRIHVVRLPAALTVR